MMRGVHSLSGVQKGLLAVVFLFGITAAFLE